MNFNNELKMNDKKNSSCIPDDLKELIRIIVLNFYGFDYFLCTEYLMIYLCLREDELAEMLKLDQKSIHEHLLTLKKEKFLNEKLMVDIKKDGKHVKHHLFYINYVSAVNVIKYKIDKIRERIEKEQLKSTETVYRCGKCSKVFTEFDMRDIFMTMRCPSCFGEIREEIHEYRNLLQLFNTKMSRVFELIKNVDKIKLPLSVLRPVALNEHVARKKPALIEQINYVRKEDLTRKGLEIFKHSKPKPAENEQKKSDEDFEEEVLDKLLKFEFKKIKIEEDQIVSCLNGEVDEKKLPTILVNGKEITFDQVTPELTDQMNEKEREAYINVIGELYSQVYDNF